MNYRMIGYLLSVILLIEAALLLFPAVVALIYGESVLPFLLTVGMLILLSLPSVLFPPKNRRIYMTEGFVCVGAAWILMSAFGAFPFVFSGAIPNYIDAFFETASGFTTTGASILREVEGLPLGILFWRSFTHWIGGMGVLVFMLAILPSSGGQAIYLMRAEVPGPTKGKLVPKLKQTALILYGIYIFLTFLMVIALLLCKMPLYDALVNAFGTAGTGGFSVKNASIAAYQNPAAEWVIAVFMVIFGVNFSLYYLLLIRRGKELFRNEELRFYLILLTVATVAFSVNTRCIFENAGSCIRAAFFQTASLMTTTGFSTVDYNQWNALSKAIVCILMMIGACAGSTAGGLKASRVLILAKSTRREIRLMRKPRSVNIIRMDGEAVPEATVRSAGSYLVIYFAVIVLSCLLISFDGFSLETNLTAVLSCLNNIGPGLGDVGPCGNFAGYSGISKLILSADMLTGRLEIIPMLILASPGTWKHR